jgi:hypothetical protein
MEQGTRLGNSRDLRGRRKEIHQPLHKTNREYAYKRLASYSLFLLPESITSSVAAKGGSLQRLVCPTSVYLKASHML